MYVGFAEIQAGAASLVTTQASSTSRPDSEGSVAMQAGEQGSKSKEYDYVSMTPSPMVGGGGGGDEPIMTWGEIGGTPLILDPSTPIGMEYVDDVYESTM